MSVTEAVPILTAIKPLTNGNHDTHSIVNDAHDASILSKDTQDLKNTLVDSSNDILADDLIAKPVESISEVCSLQFSIATSLILANRPFNLKYQKSMRIQTPNHMWSFYTPLSTNSPTRTLLTDPFWLPLQQVQKLYHPTKNIKKRPHRYGHSLTCINVAFDISMQVVQFEKPLQEASKPTTAEPLAIDQVSLFLIPF
jgi:hypothetical protein